MSFNDRLREHLIEGFTIPAPDPDMPLDLDFSPHHRERPTRVLWQHQINFIREVMAGRSVLRWPSLYSGKAA